MNDEASRSDAPRGQEGTLPGAFAGVCLRGGRRPGGRYQAGHIHGGDQALREAADGGPLRSTVDGFLRSTAEVDDA